MEFMCELPSGVYDFGWLVNWKNAREIGQELGIILDNILVREITDLSLSLVSTQKSRITTQDCFV